MGAGRSSADDPTAQLWPRSPVPFATSMAVLESALDGADVRPHPARRSTRRHGARVAVVAAVPAAAVAVVLALAYAPGRPATFSDGPPSEGPSPTVAASVTPGINPVPSAARSTGGLTSTGQPGGPGVMPPIPGGPPPAPQTTPPPPTRSTPPPTRTTAPPPTTKTPKPTGTSPSTSPQPSPTPTPTVTHVPGPVILWSPGGTVVASCQGGIVHVHSASPKPGYVLHGGLPSPGTMVGVRFRRDGYGLDDYDVDDDDVRMSIWCVNGVPESDFD